NAGRYRDAEGRRYVDLLWRTDLLAHLRYIDRLTLAAPCKLGEIPANAVALGVDPALRRLEFVDLPAPSSVFSAILPLPITVLLLSHAIGEAEVVHTGVAGWPIPLGWLASPLARLSCKPCLVVVESAPWRLIPARRAGPRARLRALVSESLARWC